MILLLLKTSPSFYVFLLLVICSMYLKLILYCFTSRKNKMFLIKEL